MLLCHSPKRQKYMCIQVCSPNKNCSSDCLCLTNVCHQMSLSNITTDNYGKQANKITYEISLEDSSNPISNINDYNKNPKPLRNSTSYLYKLKSKSNPYLNLRRNNSNENFICKLQNDINDASFNYLDNNNKYSNNHSNNNIKRNNINDFSFLRKNNDRDIISNRINGRRKDLIDKIKCLSNRLNKAIDIYQDKNKESPIYSDSNNEYNIGTYSNGGVGSDINKIKPKIVK